MEYPSPGYPSYDQPDTWAQSLQLCGPRQYPSQYISRQSSQPSINCATLYSQYAPHHAHTCPLPQSESSYHHAAHTIPSRPKSMSWPRGIFSSQPYDSSWNPQGLPAEHFEQDHRHQDSTKLVSRARMSITPNLQGLDIALEESQDPMMALGYDGHTQLALEASLEGLSPSELSKLSSLQGLSSRATPVFDHAALASLPCESGLLGLNCQFQESALPLLHTNEQAPPRRAKPALKRTDTARPIRHKRTRPSTVSNRTFVCDFCELNFDRNSNLKEHIRTHGVAKRCVPCHIPGCKKYYGRRADVNRHVKSFHKRDSVSCEYCLKTFVRSDSLTRHNVDNCRQRKQLNAPQESVMLATKTELKDEVGQPVKTEF